ncbi:uncharacterized protein LOC127791366 [Diospyros lotus]|uniref:uncharacterized protein LOC127791366 n=1 Tax=Diospyros lotus TaxID=55363 RepID=UPI00225ACF73|nr:uncharacterized protein LOC127791366 [Diospyros lotus]
MASASRAWMVAAAVGVVEALKDQGFCRWNYTMRSMHHHAKTKLRSYSQARKLPSSAVVSSSSKAKKERAKRSEETMRKVMDLNCWGPKL